MSERELIETALSVPRRIRLSVDTEVIEDAARQYLASLDASTPSDCHVYKNIYGVWRFACSFKTEQDANVMLAKYASAPSDAVTVGGHHSESGSPKDGTRGPHKLTIGYPGEGAMGICSCGHSFSGDNEMAVRKLHQHHADPLYRSSPPVPQEGEGRLNPYERERLKEEMRVAEALGEDGPGPQGLGPHFDGDDGKAYLDPSPVPQEGVCPTREPRSARDALEEMFDGDIQQADRILSRLAEEGFVVVPREPTEAMLETAGREYDSTIVPLLEENARLKARIEHWEKTADHHWSARQKLQRELNVVTELYNAGRGAEARVKELERLDSEAATHVESVICMRTDFTGEPPYVGWKGLGLALTEALDERDAAEARVEELEAYAKHERSLGAEAVAIEALGIQQNLEARVKELEDLLKQQKTPSPSP